MQIERVDELLVRCTVPTHEKPHNGLEELTRFIEGDQVMRITLPGFRSVQRACRTKVDHTIIELELRRRCRVQSFTCTGDADHTFNQGTKIGVLRAQ